MFTKHIQSNIQLAIAKFLLKTKHIWSTSNASLVDNFVLKTKTKTKIKHLRNDIVHFTMKITKSC